MAEAGQLASKLARNYDLPRKTISDLDIDALSRCAAHLSLQDISNLAMSSRYLRTVAYSDSIWLRCFREQWPREVLPRPPGVRGAFLSRRKALLQFNFLDPLRYEFSTVSRPVDHLLFDQTQNTIIYSQGHVVQSIGFVYPAGASLLRMDDHTARITCMRLFRLDETYLFRNKRQHNENVLVTASCDHSIRLWWKGSCQRCFRGHNSAISALSDKLLGDGTSKVLASGGEDGTVRLWSLSPGGKRGQQALKATLFGHEKPVKLMSVAGHKSSLLATVSNDSKVRVWDTSAIRSSCCVGMTSVPGAPVHMQCYESLLYVAAGSSVLMIDLRTMQTVLNLVTCQPKLQSFAAIPSRSLICCGGVGNAMLWDIRQGRWTVRSNPIAELDGHCGPVTHLYMDQYKIVTGAQRDNFVNVWDTDTGTKLSSLLCDDEPDKVAADISPRCSAMAVKGYRIVTASHSGDEIRICCKDFFNATRPILKSVDEPASKFWSSRSFGDSDCYSEPEMKLGKAKSFILHCFNAAYDGSHSAVLATYSCSIQMHGAACVSCSQFWPAAY